MAQIGKENLDIFATNAQRIGESLNEIGNISCNYAKDCIEGSSKAMAAMMNASDINDAVEIQAEYLTIAANEWLNRFDKITSVMTTLCNDAVKPIFENIGGLSADMKQK